MSLDLSRCFRYFTVISVFLNGITFSFLRINRCNPKRHKCRNIINPGDILVLIL